MQTVQQLIEAFFHPSLLFLLLSVYHTSEFQVYFPSLCTCWPSCGTWNAEQSLTLWSQTSGYQALQQNQLAEINTFTKLIMNTCSIPFNTLWICKNGPVIVDMKEKVYNKTNLSVFPPRHTQQYPPYLYTVCTDSCTAVPHIPSNSFITLSQHFNFTSTHLIRPYRTVL